MRNLGLGLAVVTAAMTASSASAAVLLTDDMSTSGNWSVSGTADSAATFGFDYSTVGIPMAPGASNTLALKLEANNGDATAGAENIAAVSTTSFSGTYQVTLNFWSNYIGDIQFGGSGSTEFTGAGIGHDGVATGHTSGSVLSITGDAGSGTDVRAFVGSSQQALGPAFNPLLTSLNAPSVNADLGLFPSVSAPAAQLGLFASQTGSTEPGAAGFDWHEMVITVDEVAGTAIFDVNGVNVVTLASGSGGVSLTHADLFSSVTGDPAVQFALFTNVVVTDVPEPASLALLGLGGLAMLRRR